MAFLPVNVEARQSPIDPRPRLLIVELWGLGDLVFATSLIAPALESYDITLLAKPHARALLSGTFPQLRFIELDAPWTVFTGKYRVWNWDWPTLGRAVSALRAGKFDVAVAGRRADPRDHFLMRMSGAPRRVGYPYRRTPGLLNDPIDPGVQRRHVVDDWRAIAERLGLSNQHGTRLDGSNYPKPAGLAASRPRLCLHTGARIPVRRWSEDSFAEIIRRLRARFDFELVLVPDPDGYGLGLAPLADRVIEKLPLPELVGLLASCAMLLCNDSGPGHIADACGTPALAVFGPTDPVRFSPWSAKSRVLIRDLCEFRPCMDYCRFPEPYCLTRLLPAELWPEIEEFAGKHLSPRKG